MQICCELPANYSTCVDDDNNNADYVFNCAITSDTYVEDVYSNDELFVQFSRVGDCFTLSLFANSAVSNGVWDNVLFNGNNIIFGKQYATDSYNSIIYFYLGTKVETLFFIHCFL